MEGDTLPAIVTATNALTGAERVQRHAVRQVARVPEAVFESYTKNAENPTRAGLLRYAKWCAERGIGADPT